MTLACTGLSREGPYLAAVARRGLGPGLALHLLDLHHARDCQTCEQVQHKVEDLCIVVRARQYGLLQLQSWMYKKPAIAMEHASGMYIACSE